MGRVIKIISREEIIINLGEKDKISLGDAVYIYKEFEDVTLIDPFVEEGEPRLLGKLRYIKADLRVKQVFENYSIVGAEVRYEEELVPEPEESPLSRLLKSPLEAAMTPRKKVRKIRKMTKDKLPIREDDIEHLISPEDRFIKVGDYVKMAD